MLAAGGETATRPPRPARERVGGAAPGPSRRTTYVVVGAAVVAAVLLRVPFLHDATYPDEGGMLTVAREWHTGGPYLYGDLFLARPPLIMAFFRLAADLGGILALRTMALGLVAVAVASAGWAGRSLGGRRGAMAGVVVSAMLLSNPMLGSREIDAETVGLPFAMTAAACVLAAYHRPQGSRPRAWLLLAGGALATCALLSKQSLGDSLAFGGILVVATGLVATRRRIAAVRDLLWFLLGVAVPTLLTVIWAITSSVGVHELVYELFGFRAQGGQTLLTQPTSAQNARLGELLRSLFWSGIVPIDLVALWHVRRRWRDPITLALVAMLLVAVLGVAGGQQYWIHYALGLVPVTALLAAYAVGRVAWPRVLSGLVVAAVGVTAFHVGDAWQHRTDPGHTWVGGTSIWLRETKQPGDTMVVLYGEAAVYETSRVRPAYPYIWTLPMRVLDPHLDGLSSLLSGAEAPTFVLVPSPLNAWGIDPHGALQQTLDQHYREVATVCGSPVYLRKGVHRPIAAVPPGCG